MVERVSALAAVYQPGIVGEILEDVGPRVRLRETRDLCIMQIAAWPETLEHVREALSAALAGAAAPGFGKWVPWGADGRLVRVEPLKWWLMGSEEVASDPALPDLLPGAAVELDLSHSRTGIRITGPSAAELVMRFMSVDLRAGSFPNGAVATGLFDHVAATVLRDDGENEAGYELLLPRTFAESCWPELVEAAGRFGAEILPSDG